MGVEVDEIYFRESFKGTPFEGLENKPREPRHDRIGSKQGISDDQICVVTAYDDAGSFFFDVACRGALTHDIALDTLKGRISSGAIVNTDKHRAYSKVMREIGVALHNAVSSKEGALPRGWTRYIRTSGRSWRPSRASPPNGCICTLDGTNGSGHSM
jgi:hypothetical protein